MPEPKISFFTGEPIEGSPTIDAETNLPKVSFFTGEAFTPKPRGSRMGTDFNISRGIMGSEKSMGYTDDIDRFMKYGVPLGRNLDWEEIRARNQSTAEKWGHGLAKAAVTTLGAISENTIGFLAGMGELITGGAYYDNFVGKTVDKTNEWMREHMPNYYTKREQEMSVLQGMGTANFWADKVAGGVGYSVGSIATIWLTGGGGLITKGISSAARGLGIYNASKAIINGTALAKTITKGASLSTRLRTATQMLEAGAMMSLAEGSVESRETQRQTYDTLVQQYLQKRPGMTEGDIPSNKLQDFENVSYAAGNTNFVFQMPVLMGTNLLMFGKQVTGFKGMSRANADVMFDATANQAVNKLAKQGIVAQSLSRLRPVFVNGMGETVQESLQFGSGAFSSTYHTDKYNNGGHGDMSKALTAAGDAMLSKEGLESALIGFLTGGIMGGGQSIIGKEYTNRRNNAQALTDLVNSGIFDKANQRYGTAEASSAVLKRMHDSLQKGDIKKFKDEQYKLIQYQALEALERGGFDVMVQKLEDSKELSETEFMTAYGYPQEDNSGKPLTLKDSTDKSQEQILDGVIEKLNRFEQTYDNVNQRFPLQDKTSGLPRLLMSKEEREAEDAVYNKQQNLRSNLIFYGSEVRDRNRRMDSITNQMQDTLDNSLQSNAYAGSGPQLNVHSALQEQRPSFKGVDLLKDETGEVEPASEYNPDQQYIDTANKLQQIADSIRQVDPIAADTFMEQARDYLDLLKDNNRALDNYNKLSSDTYVQEQLQREIEEREAIAKQNKIDKTVTDAIDSAETSADFKDVDFDNASPEVSIKGIQKLKELRDAETAEYRKYMVEKPDESDEEKLERLKKLDKSELTPIQKAGLEKAINVLEKELNEDPVVEEEVPSREEDSVFEEAFQPDNVGGIELISEDGREFQVDGVKLYNRELDPLDAIVRTRAGRIKKIRLTDEYGNRQVIWGPEARVDALAYAILMSEQFRIDVELGKVREEILEQKEVVTEEVDKELGTKGVHGAKTSESLRQEIYSLELGLNAILETYDNLRTSYIQEAGATKEELKDDPDLKELKSKIRSLKLQIANRRRILKLRNEDVTPTDPEILKVENKANAAIEDYNISLSESENTVKQLEDEIANQESRLSEYQEADDLESWKQATNDIKKKGELISKELDKQEKLKHKINYQQAKLKRLQDAKDNDPNQNAEPTEQGITEQAEGPIDEREDKNIGEVTEEQEAPIEEDAAEEQYNNEEKATNKKAIITINSNSNTAEDTQSEPGTPIQIVSIEGVSIEDLKQEGSTTDLGSLITPAVPPSEEAIAPVEEQIKKSEYEVHVTGDMIGGWDITTYMFNVPGIEIKDMRGKAWKVGERIFDESIQNGKKVFTIVDGSIRRGNRRAGISASMVFNENTTVTLEEVKNNLNNLMDSLLTIDGKKVRSFTQANVSFDWGKLNIKEIATPTIKAPVAPVAPQENEGIENTGTNDLEVKAANIDKVQKVGEDTYDKRAPRRVVVDESGNPSKYVPDMSNGQIITINQDLLLSPDIEGTEVTFEIRPNDYFTKRVEEEGLENSWQYVPIYYKIGDEYVGKLAENDSPQRKALANKLENGEIVTTKISRVRSSAKNINHAIKENGDPFFTHPEAVFGKNEVILGITNIYENKFDLGDVDPSLDKGDSEAITTAVAATSLGGIGPGQVIAVIRGRNNPQGDPRVTPLSTANLNSTAQEAVMRAFKDKDFYRASQIIAHSNIIEAAEGNPTFLEFSVFPDGSQAIVYTSPSTGNLVRIKDTQLQKALNGEEYKYDFVKVNEEKYQVYTPKNNVVDIKEDLTKFVTNKKYQVDKTLMNMATDYTSPITGKTYKSTTDAPLGYQQYLFSPTEVTGNRILSTDIVKIGESLFNNPEVIFEGIDKDIVGEVETELKIERNDIEIIEDIADEDISFDDKTNECD